MQWINTRSNSSDEALKQSILETYSLPECRFRGNLWMNLDNGDTIWMLYDRVHFRFFRHFPSAGSIFEVTESFTGKLGEELEERFDVQLAAKKWEALIDKLLDASYVDDYKK